MRRLLLLSLIALSAPASAEVASVSDAGFVIQLSGETNASRAEVWKVLIAPSQWWSGQHTFGGKAENLYLDAQATGCFCEKLPKPKDAPETQRMGSVEHMHVVQADPQRGILRMRGALGPLQSEALVGTLTVSIKPAEVGSTVAWSYVVGGFMRMKPQDIAPLVDKVLTEQFTSLLAKSVPEPKADPALPNQD